MMHGKQGHLVWIIPMIPLDILRHIISSRNRQLIFLSVLKLINSSGKSSIVGASHLWCYEEYIPSAQYVIAWMNGMRRS